MTTMDHRITHAMGMLGYEAWATSATIDSLSTVPAEQLAGPAFTRAIQIVAHIQIARRVWMARIEGRIDRPADWFPAWRPLQLREAAAELDKVWHDYLVQLTPAELDRHVVYQSFEGVKYSSRVFDILMHVFNHSTYHRGQVARFVTEAGGTRATTDMIAFSRKVI
ncbi:MAG TPA: DinB family protein [Phycisphaerales bacterium]|nr:DinB family protein [Phycisphaerales bacterium]